MQYYAAIKKQSHDIFLYMDMMSTMLSKNESEGERDTQNNLTYHWGIRKIKDNVGMVSRENKDENKEDHSMVERVESAVRVEQV